MKYSLKECIDKIIDNRGKNPNQYYFDEKYPVLDNYLIKNEIYPNLMEVNRFIDINTFNIFIRNYLEKNDVIMTLVGNGIGNVSMSPSDKVVIIQNTIGFRTKQDILLNKFLYYYFKYINRKLLNFNRGSSQPSIKKTDILDMIIDIPTVDKQKAIVEILFKIDMKIQNNNKINEKLEEMAQVIFNQWFIDFEFPNDDGEPYKSSGGKMVESELGMIPKGWTNTSLYDLAEYINGTSFKKGEISELDGMPIIKIAELKDGITSSTKHCICDKPEKYYLKNGDILFSWSGNPETSIDTFIWYRGEGILNQHIFKVTSTIYSNEFIYLILKYFKPLFMQIASNKQTTGLGHVTISDLKRLKISLPNQDLIDSFTSIVGPIIKKMHNNDLESYKLNSLRDDLLPKLMSGEIRVPIDTNEN